MAFAFTSGFPTYSPSTTAPTSTFPSFSASPSSSSSSYFPSFSTPAASSSSSPFASTPSTTSTFSFLPPRSSSSSSLTSSTAWGAPALTPSTNPPAPTTLPFAPSTPFTSLPDDVRTFLLSLERHIRGQTTLDDDLATLTAAAQSTTQATPPLAELLTSVPSQLALLRVRIEQDAEAVQGCLRRVTGSARQVELTGRRVMKVMAVGGVGGGGGGGGVEGGGVGGVHAGLGDGSQLLLPMHFHWQRLAECEAKVKRIRAEVGEIEEVITAADSSPSSTLPLQGQVGGGGTDVSVLSSVLQAQYAFLVDVSSRLAGLHQQVDALRMAQTARNGRSGGDTQRPTPRALTSHTYSPSSSSSLPSSTPTTSPSTSFTSTSSPTSFSTAGSAMGGGGQSLGSGAWGVGGGAGMGGFGSGASAVPTLPSAPSSLSASISAGQEGGLYRTLTGRRPLTVRKK